MTREDISKIATQMALADLSTIYPNVAFNDKIDVVDGELVYKDKYQVDFNNFYDDAEQVLSLALERGRCEPSPEGYCIVTVLHRDNLLALGFDAENTDIDTIDKIALQMGTDYAGDGFEENLEINAKALGVVKIEKEED